MNAQHAPLLTEVDAFLAEARMSETTFGRLAVNDGKFVARIRSGGRCWPETEEKARAFMASRRTAASNAA